ncbi:MAG: Ger(x)C family spore germination protein [Clostridiales bacterium]|nr:Ger(x)C family spore germination protein [Clostridiales bacterium]
MSQKKKIIIMFLAALLLYLHAGCWSRREINELAFVMALGIDSLDGGKLYKVSVQTANTKTFAKEGSGSTEEKSFAVYTATGATPAEAVRNLSQQLPRRLLLSHCRLVLISENLAKSGVEPVLDFLQRNREVRETVWVLVAKGQADVLLEQEFDMEDIPADTLSRLIKLGEETSRGYAATKRDFLYKLTTARIDPVAASVEVLPDVAREGKPGVQLGGLAVFRADKLAGWLDAKETRGFLWVTGEAAAGSIVLDSPLVPGKVTFEFLRVQSRVTPQVRDGRVVILLDVETQGDLGDLAEPWVSRGQDNSGGGMEELIKEVERGVQETIEDEILAALHRVQREYKADIFGFGDAIHRRLPNEWRKIEERWDEIYPSLEIHIKVSANLRSSGQTCHYRHR